MPGRYWYIIMTIKLYRTTKRRNSTATPTSKPALFELRTTLTDVRMKDESNVLTPSFLLNMQGHDGSNFIEAFGRFYWVRDVVLVRANLIQINCIIDVLGSYRGHILNTQAFVLFDSTANSELPDRRLGVKTSATYSTATADMPWNFASGLGTNLICVAGNGKNTDGAGSTGVYAITRSGIDDLGFQIQDLLEEVNDQAEAYGQVYDDYVQQAQSELAAIVTDPQRMIPHAIVGIGYFNAAIAYGFKAFFIEGLKNLWQAIVKLFTGGDALKNIRAAYWLPFIVPKDGMPYVSKLALGGFVEEIQGGLNKMIQPIYPQTATVSIPWQFTDWRNVACTEIQLYIPLIGNISIPASAVKGHNSLTLYFSLNIYSGLFSVRIMCGDATLGTFGVDSKMPIMIGDSNVNAGAVLNTIAAGAAAIATSGAAAIAATGAAIASGFESLTPVNTTVGGIGGGAGNSLGSTIQCTTIAHGTSQEPSALLPIIGTPTNQLKTLSNISGYCQTMDAHMNMAAVTGESWPTEGEVTEVDNYLNSGVYIE